MFLFAFFATDGQSEFLAGFEIQRNAQIAGANGRSLRVHHDADKNISSRGCGTDVFDDATDPIMGRVRHVEAKDIDAGLNKFAEHFRGIRCGSKSGDDFRVAHFYNIAGS